MDVEMDPWLEQVVDLEVETRRLWLLQAASFVTSLVFFVSPKRRAEWVASVAQLVEFEFYVNGELVDTATGNELVEVEQLEGELA